MARPETPIDPRNGPLATFAMELRKLREHAGVTYRELAQRGHCSPSALNEAANGRQLPTWLVTEAFVKGCGADSQQWEARWQAVAAEVKGDLSTASAPRNGGGAVTAPSDSSDVGDHLPTGDVPPLSSITSPQDFHLALRALRIRAGKPSLRELSVLARKHGDHVLPRSTLADALDRTDRLPSLEIVVAFLSACDVQATEVEGMKSAWARVAYHLQRESMSRSSRWQDRCPYLGLAAFREDQAELFYGRENLTIELLAKLADRVRGGVGMLVVAGPSGAGKSSLLRAGLLPQLAQGKLGPGSQDWPRLVITPGSTPLEELAVPLAQLAGVNSTEIKASLAEHPDTAPLNARQALLACAAQHAGPEPRISPSRLVLIVDQFEELFTAVSDKTEREAFITSLCAMAGVGRHTTELPPALVVLGLRADFLSDCTTYAPLAEAVRSNVFLVGPMTEVELRSAITGPAETAGLSIEAGLVDNVLAELRSAGTAGGFDAGALPLLSQAMLLTWERREGTTLTRYAYAAGGGLRNGIQTSAGVAYHNLTPTQQEAARILFRRMVTFTDHGLLTRRPIPLNDLNIGSSTAADVSAVLEGFANQRLITLSKDTAEIVHEVLVHSWQQLGSWIDQDREWLRLSRKLEDVASAWEENGQDPAFLYRNSRLATVLESVNETDSTVSPSVQSFLASSKNRERRRTRTLRGLSTLVGLLAVVAILAGGSIFLENRSIDKFERMARESTSQAAKHPDIAMALAVEAYHQTKTPTTRSALLNAQSQYYAGQLHLADQKGAINKVAFSPDGKILATANAKDHTAQLWDVNKRRPIATLPSPGEVNDVEFSPNGHVLVTAGQNSIPQLWDVASQQLIAARTDYPDPASADVADTTFTTATFSPNGNFLATVRQDGIAQLWNVASHNRITNLDNNKKIKKIAFNPAGNTLATVDIDTIIQLWNVTDPQHPTPLGFPLPPIKTANRAKSNVVAFSHDGTILATINGNDTTVLWNVRDPEHPSVDSTLPGHASIINAVTFNADGTILATAGADGTADLWNVATRQLITTLKGHTGPILSVMFSSDGHTIATAGNDTITRLWDTAGPILSSPTIVSNLSNMEFSPDGRFLANTDGKGALRLWDIGNRRQNGTLANKIDKSKAMAFNEDGKLLAIIDTDNSAQLWDIASQRSIAKLSNLGKIDKGKIDKIVFIPNGHTLAIIDANGVMRLWDVTDPLNPSFPDPFMTDYYTHTVAFNRDGHILATVSNADGSTQLWNMAKLQQITTLQDRKSNIAFAFISKMVFSSNGGSLTTVSDDATLRRWEATTGKLLDVTRPRKTTPLEERSYPLALSPDGRFLATTSNDDTTTKLWDMDNDGELFATLAGHTGPINTAVFSGDGRFLATSSSDGTVRLWDLDADRVTRNLCHIIGTLTKEKWKELMPNFPHQPTCT